MDFSFDAVRTTISSWPWLQKPWVILTSSSVLLIVIEYLTRVRFMPPSAVTYILSWLVLAVTFSILANKELLNFHHEEDRFMVSLFLSGLLVGFVSAVFKVFAHHELWTAFNLLAEPMRTALFALVVGWLFLMRDQSLRHHARTT